MSRPSPSPGNRAALLKESHRINRGLGQYRGTVSNLRTFARVLALRGREAAVAEALEGGRTLTLEEAGTLALESLE